MFAIAFDLVVAQTEALHPRGQQAAYAEIGAVLRRRTFRRVQGSVYLTESNDLSVVFAAIADLKALPWFPGSVRDIRAFRVENWSDFTGFIQAP